MAIFNLFSKRQKQLRGEVPEVYSYEHIPDGLRVQIVHIIQDTIGKEDYNAYNRSNEPKKVYRYIYDVLCREYGLFYLTSQHDEPENQVLDFLLQQQDVEKVLDVVELTFRYINLVISEDYQRYKYVTTVKTSPEHANSDLNIRFKENGVGYSFEGNKIIRIDSTYAHSEITKPVISLLWNHKFQGANEEYMKAHEHYRQGRNKECLTECLKAFESTMKIICTEKGWAFNPGDTASKLIQVCLQNDLVPSYMQNQITGLRSVLESGIPTIRNKTSGHGQGQVPQKVDDEMARYGLNLTGANIIFLVEQSGL